MPNIITMPMELAVTIAGFIGAVVGAALMTWRQGELVVFPKDLYHDDGSADVKLTFTTTAEADKFVYWFEKRTVPPAPENPFHT